MPDEHTFPKEGTSRSGSLSSRESRAAAGWHCDEVGRFRELVPAGSRPFSWLSPVPLIKSRNDLLARAIANPTDEQRRRWLARQRAAGADPDLTVRTYGDRGRVSFLVLGDTGEGDASQYCVVPGLLTRAEGTAFMVVASDVIYPAGGVNEYGTKFYRPYRDYPAPIYAVPGNHDWYDGLHGFMRHFCGTASPAGFGAPGAPWLAAADSVLERAAMRLLWREPPAADEQQIARMQALRGRPEQQGSQPAPYFALEAGPVLLVGIDTGITGRIDAEQGAWLQRISRSSPRPKILLTGTPLYADAQRNPVPIEGSETTVDDVVRAPEHRYLAAIGGSWHNYQRYPVRLGDGRTIQYLVSGGGGAFLHDTHLIPRVDLPGVSEEDFRCYPLRGDSLSRYSQTFRRRLGWLLGDVFIPPEQAAALMAEKIGTDPAREAARDVEITHSTRRAYRRLLRLPQRLPAALHEYARRFFDRNDPPLFKSFLRADAGAAELTIRCFAATGCRAHELDPPREDAVRCVRGPDGTWRWE